jgi:hypothetical protein
MISLLPQVSDAWCTLVKVWCLSVFSLVLKPFFLLMHRDAKLLCFSEKKMILLNRKIDNGIV